MSWSAGGSAARSCCAWSEEPAEILTAEVLSLRCYAALFRELLSPDWSWTSSSILLTISADLPFAWPCHRGSEGADCKCHAPPAQHLPSRHGFSPGPAAASVTAPRPYFDEYPAKARPGWRLSPSLPSGCMCCAALCRQPQLNSDYPTQQARQWCRRLCGHSVQSWPLSATDSCLSTQNSELAMKASKV